MENVKTLFLVAKDKHSEKALETPQDTPNTVNNTATTTYLNRVTQMFGNKDAIVKGNLKLACTVLFLQGAPLNRDRKCLPLFGPRLRGRT